MEAAAADLCSEPGANFVGPEVLIGNRELVTDAVRRIVCQPRDPTDAGFIRLRLYQLHKRGAPMTERLHPPGMVPERSGDRVDERVPISASATLMLERPRPYEVMEYEGYDAMRRIIRHRVAARRGLAAAATPLERLIEAWAA
jgi:hypothetical protein